MSRWRLRSGVAASPLAGAAGGAADGTENFTFTGRPTALRASSRYSSP